MKKFIPLFCLFLSACMVGPDYVQPPANVPETWENASKNQSGQPIWNEIKWWENYKDPLLTQLVRETIKSNYDLKVAFTKICQMNANLLGAEASIAPEIDWTGSYAHNQNSLNTRQFSTDQGFAPVGTGAARNRIFDIYTTGLTTNWEIDLFGRIRRSIESAEATLGAQIEDMHNTLLSLIAEVASTYINLRGYQEQLEITQKFYEEWDKIYLLNQDLMRAGLVTEIEVSQAKTSRDQAHASLSPLKQNIKASMHKLAILTGKSPTCLYDLLLKAKPIPQTPNETFAGLPSELLKRRPDIRQAERNLAAATAQIGVAEGALFPVFSLTGTVGYQSNLSSNFISPNSGFYAYGPGFTWPIMDFGRVRSKICAAMATRDQNFYQYYSTVLKALSEVENALVNFDGETKRYADLKKAYDASKLAAEISLARFDAGKISFINVLQAEITYQTAALALAQSQITLALNSVNLYKTLGGGWQNEGRPCLQTHQ
jgi:multidrug efflux system outer membrane protein